MKTPSCLYQEVVRRRCPPPSKPWWDAALTLLAAPFPKEAFVNDYARAARMLGNEPCALAHEERLALFADEPPFCEGRPLHEVGRAALLLSALASLPPTAHAELVDELFLRGDSAEREAVLRALPLLPDPSRFLDTAVEACRTNVQTVFEAIACGNPYPARVFPESNFNQMVMKAVFLGVSLRRIAGLPDRVTPALASMAADYVRERTAAGRPVSDELALLAPNDSQG